MIWNGNLSCSRKTRVPTFYFDVLSLLRLLDSRCLTVRFSFHVQVFTATTSTWSKQKKAADADSKKSTTAKPTTVSGSTGSVSRTTRALKPAVVTATPDHRDLTDIDAEASASVLHHHVAQLTPLGAALREGALKDPVKGSTVPLMTSTATVPTTTDRPTSYVTPSSSEEDVETPSGPEIIIVESKRERTSAEVTDAVESTVTTAASSTPDTTAVPSTTAPTSAPTTDSTRDQQRTTRAVKTIGRRPDGSRYILSEEEAKQQNPAQALAQAQRTKLQVSVGVT